MRHVHSNGVHAFIPDNDNVPSLLVDMTGDIPLTSFAGNIGNLTPDDLNDFVELLADMSAHFLSLLPEHAVQDVINAYVQAGTGQIAVMKTALHARKPLTGNGGNDD